MQNIRVFIAVRLPAEVRRRLAELVKRMMQSGADVKWTPEENFHITLKFIGDMEQRKIAAVTGAVERALAGVSPFDLDLAGVGVFPNMSSPRVVWVGITTGTGELKSLAKRVEDELAEVGFPKENRPFNAHVTLGRVRSPRDVDKLRECIEAVRSEPIGSVHVAGVSVMRSELQRGGSVYTELADLRL